MRGNGPARAPQGSSFRVADPLTAALCLLKLHSQGRGGLDPRRPRPATRTSLAIPAPALQAHPGSHGVPSAIHNTKYASAFAFYLAVSPSWSLLRVHHFEQQCVRLSAPTQHCCGAPDPSDSHHPIPPSAACCDGVCLHVCTPHPSLSSLNVHGGDSR